MYFLQYIIRNSTFVSIATCMVNNQRLLWFAMQYSAYSIDLHVTRMCVNFVYISTCSQNFFVIIIHVYSCSFWAISMNFDFDSVGPDNKSSCLLPWTWALLFPLQSRLCSLTSLPSCICAV